MTMQYGYIFLNPKQIECGSITEIKLLKSNTDYEDFNASKSMYQ